MRLVEKCTIPDLYILDSDRPKSDESSTSTTFDTRKLKIITGNDYNFIQENESFSRFGVLRGLHYQGPPYSQTKLVKVISGRVYDFAIDLRVKSPTYLHSKGVELSSGNKKQFLIPPGFAHGFIVLSKKGAIFSYKVDQKYSPEVDSGIFAFDKELNLDWHLEPELIIISEKDSKLQSLSSYKENPLF